MNDYKHRVLSTMTYRNGDTHALLLEGTAEQVGQYVAKSVVTALEGTYKTAVSVELRPVSPANVFDLGRAG